MRDSSFSCPVAKKFSFDRGMSLRSGIEVQIHSDANSRVGYIGQAIRVLFLNENSNTVYELEFETFLNP